MDHQLVRAIGKTLPGWSEGPALGQAFSAGRLPDPGLCERLLTPAGLLDIIQRRSLTYPQLRCLQAGEDLHPRDYLTSRRTGRGQVIEVADMRRLGTLLAEGCTLVLDDVAWLDPTLEVTCRALQWWLGELVRVNVYLTTATPAPSGFGLHWDGHDVLILHLAGEKSWEVRGPSRRAPMERDAEPNLDPPNDVVWSGTVRPGDVLHIPRGWWHRASRPDHGTMDYSLHATFGITQRTGVDYVSWLADQACADERFRRDLTAPNRAELARAVADLAAGHPAPEFLSTRQNEQPAARYADTRVFGEPAEVVCVTEFRPSLHHVGTTVVVTAAGKRITLADKALPALVELLSGHPVSPQDVAEETGVDAVALAHALVEAGILAAVTPALAHGCRLLG